MKSGVGTAFDKSIDTFTTIGSLVAPFSQPTWSTLHDGACKSALTIHLTVCSPVTQHVLCLITTPLVKLTNKWIFESAFQPNPGVASSPTYRTIQSWPRSSNWQSPSLLASAPITRLSLYTKPFDSVDGYSDSDGLSGMVIYDQGKNKQTMTIQHGNVSGTVHDLVLPKVGEFSAILALRRCPTIIDF